MFLPILQKSLSIHKAKFAVFVLTFTAIEATLANVIVLTYSAVIFFVRDRSYRANIANVIIE